MTIHDTRRFAPPVELLVCMTCRQAGAVPALDGGADDAREGARLHAALAADALPDGVTLRAVECLSNCSRGCSVALRGSRAVDLRLRQPLGRRRAVVADGAARYRATPDGLVPWRERPEHFRRNCIARIPPLEVADA